MAELIVDMRTTLSLARRSENTHLGVIADRLEAAIESLEAATSFILETLNKDMAAALGGAVNYLMLVGYVCGGWQMARAALAAIEQIEGGAGNDFLESKIVTARFYAEHLLPRAGALAETVAAGTDSLFLLTEEQL
jgi:acyl-CoA dehydrogenase